jgi:copper transport protein
VGNGQGFPDAAGLTSLLAHWIELLAAVTWAGTAIFSAFILGPLRPGVDEATQEREAGRTRRTIWASLILLASSSTVIVALQAYSLAGNNWGGVLTRSTLTDVFADQYGQLWIGRQAIVLVSLVLSLTVARLAEEDGPRFGEQAIVAGIYLYALAGSGHAAAAAIGVLPGTHSNLFSISIFLDWLHLLGDATWFGGQIYIVLVLIPALFARGLERNGSLFLDVLNRFSPAAFASIAFFVLTGTFSGKVQIGSWYAFFNSIYGRALIVKIALIGLMMLVSAYTVFRLRPSIRSSGIESGEGTARLGRLRGWLGVNPFLGAGVLLATSIMFSYPVPPGLSPPGPSAYTFRAGALTGTLAVKPDRSGLNTITVTLRDSAGRPVQQAHVTVLTTMLDMVMGTGVASLREASPGAFSGTTDLGMGGHWKLQVLVYQPSGLTRANVEVRVAT